MEFSEKIYKKDSKGKIRVLHVHTIGSMLIQESGILDGALVKHEHTCTGKNIGRSNETSPEEQAQSEAASKIETKLSTGYFKTIDEVNNNVVILPMLAKDYKKESHKVVFPCYVQPKLDGMRMLGEKNKTFISRKGKEIPTLNHIQGDIDNITYTSKVFDGEAYAHGKTFQENMRLIKKYRPGQTEDVKYHIYDMIEKDIPFPKRYAVLRAIFDMYSLDHLELVPTYLVDNEEELKAYHGKFISEGYEGTIVRHSDAGYGINKRDSQLLKYKDFIDIDAVIIDITPNVKNPTHGTPHFIIDGKPYKAGIRMSHAEREDLLTNKNDFIGKKANLRFFEYSDDGIPRFPVMIGVHEDR